MPHPSPDDPTRVALNGHPIDSDPPADAATAPFHRPDRPAGLQQTVGLSAETRDFTPVEAPRIPGYEILGELGRGGMGVVYKARQTALGREVALKVVLAGAHARPDELVRFLAEAETAARLRHQGIVQIYESGRHSGLPYFSMEYVDGGSLADRLKDGPLPAADAARVALQLAEAVAHAHACGIVHRDLKPANILLTRDESRGTSPEDKSGSSLAPRPSSLVAPKITDFGLARRLEAGDGLTMSGQVLGTPSYMPPEQARGDVHHVGPAGDVYALGAVLYSMLTARPPFHGGTSAEVLARVQNAPPAKPRGLNPAVSRDLETICLKCLEKEPGKRYASAAALADDLRRFLEGRSIKARRASPAEKVRRWAKRNPAVAALLAAVLLTLTAGTVASTVLAVRSAAHADRADGHARDLGVKVVELDAARKDAVKLAGEATDARRDLALTLADSYTTLGLTAGDREQPALAALWFARAVGLSGGDPDREFHNRVRVRNWLVEAFTPVGAVGGTGFVTHLRFHPGGDHLLGWRPGGRHYLWDLGREAPWAAPPGFGDLTAAAWNPTGTLVALGTAGGKAGVFRFPSGEPVETWDRGGPVAAVAFDPAGNRVAVGGPGVRVWDLGEKRFATPELAHPRPYGVLFTPDGRRLVTAGADESARVFDLTADTPAPAVTTRHRPTPFEDGALTPINPILVDDGKTLVVITGRTTLAGIDPATGAERFTGTSAHPLAFFLALDAAPDGRTFRTCGGSELLVWGADGKRIGAAIEHRNTVNCSDLTPDGRFLVTACSDRQARVWDLAARTVYGPILPHTAGVYAVACSADGTRLATAQSGGLLRVWRFPRPAPVRPADSGGPTVVVRCSRDGRYFYPAGGTSYGNSLRRVAVIDAATGGRAFPPVEPGGSVLDADLSPDNRLLLTATTPHQDDDRRKRMNGPGAGEVRFWSVADGRPHGDPIPTPSEPRSVRFRPDGAEAAVACAAGEVLVLDPAAARRVRAFHPVPTATGNGHWVNNGMIRYTPDGGRLVVYGMAPGLLVLDAATGAERFRVPTTMVYDGHPTADGSAVGAGDLDGAARVFDLSDGRQLGPALPHPTWVFSVRFSRDGRRVLTACKDQSARLWDRAAGRVLAVFPHADEVFCAEFTPDERFVVTGGADGMFRVWPPGTGRPVCPAVWPAARVTSIVLTPDGRRAAVGGLNAGLAIVDVDELTRPAGGPADDLVRAAELAAGQRIDDNGGVVNLTGDEWLARWKAGRPRAVNR